MSRYPTKNISKPNESVASSAGTRLALLGMSAVLFFATLTAWHNSFSVPMLLDDPFAITNNPSIQRLWPIGPVLVPPAHATTIGRPLLNLSFALNYAFNGTRVQGYHAFSVLAHILVGITLLGVVRRTLLLPKLREKFGPAALPLAFFIALLWLLHPLQTESITYISQRAEVLFGLFYLLALYGLIRGATSTKPRLAYGLAIGACALGMATKEAMVTAPVLILLYDRVFLAGTFKAIWQQRRWFYLGLMATWLVLAYCMIFLHGKFTGIGFTGKFTWWTYALTESKVVMQYLKLALWPHPLVFDYGPEMMISRVGQAMPYLLPLGLLLAAIAVSWRRRPAVAFLGSWIFLILAPTSSVVPVMLQPMAENRMYLPLVAVIALGVLGLYARMGSRSFLVFLVVAVGLGTLTVRRNRDYQSEIAIWTDTVAKRPQNARAHVNLANALADIPSRREEAIAHYEAALRINPNADEAHNNLANLLMTIPERLADAIVHYEAMVRINPGIAEAHYNLGNALMRDPARVSDAIPHYEKAAQLKPGFADLNLTLGTILADIPGREPEAAAHFEKALEHAPDSWPVHFNLASILGRMPERQADAIAHYEATLRIRPGLAIAHSNLGYLLSRVPGRLAKAIEHYEKALRIEPGLAEAHNNLGNALHKIPGRQSDAIAHYEKAIQFQPDYALAHFNLGAALLEMPTRKSEAIDHLESALRLDPELKRAREMLDRARGTLTAAPLSLQRN